MAQIPSPIWQIPVQRHNVLVKICGLTLVDNALDCVKAGADIIGLVFFEKSPRHVSTAKAREIARALPKGVPACGVFVNETYNSIMQTVSACGLEIVQLHGAEPPDLAERLSAQNLVVTKAFFAAKPPKLCDTEKYPSADFCLAEYGKGILPGGNAETWDYNQALDMAKKVRLMLAGGLNPANVADAVARIHPYAVDVSSGVEKTKGIKDIAKVKAFVRAAKSVSI
ncbi:MAG: phosphoribosylanthranilate isomerase [Desulfobacter postgatei]|uniref:phosphoribosylanthranilate isomerase n=1 Tax=Desulfobacter postgatei TaxID=2293 RepID=UPI0023EFC1FA|nr:phosphoribosylanthranilate isomerase [Desulfobacter postgatei]MDD4272219.1 phosphoribosylanthranilate isomerase [Desulfobacter postgatei]